MFITNDIKYVGVNDHDVDLFEGQYPVPNGMAYNSFVILDEKIAVMDTVDARFTHQWLDNIEDVLGGKKPDYIIIQHMEPDHSANILNFMNTYPQTKIVASEKAFDMIIKFFGKDFANGALPASSFCISLPIPLHSHPRHRMLNSFFNQINYVFLHSFHIFKKSFCQTVDKTTFI